MKVYKFTIGNLGKRVTIINDKEVLYSGQCSEVPLKLLWKNVIYYVCNEREIVIQTGKEVTL